MFMKKAKVMSEWRSLNVARVIDIFIEHEGVYYVTEANEGQTLEQYTDRRPLQAAKAKSIIEQLANGLEVFHSKIMPNLGLSAGTVIIDSATGQPVITTFSLPLPLMTPEEEQDPYSAPERFEPSSRDEIGHDIYSLGAILFRCLTGYNPPRNTTIALEGIDYPDTVSDEMADVVDRALESRFVNRYMSTDEMIEALNGDAEQGNGLLSYYNGTDQTDSTDTQQEIADDYDVTRRSDSQTSSVADTPVADSAAATDEKQEDEDVQETEIKETEPSNDTEPANPEFDSNNQHEEIEIPDNGEDAVADEVEDDEEDEEDEDEEPFREPIDHRKKNVKGIKTDPEKDNDINNGQKEEKKKEKEDQEDEKENGNIGRRKQKRMLYAVIGLLVVGLILGAAYAFFMKSESTLPPPPKPDPDPIPTDSQYVAPVIPDEKETGEVTDKEMAFGPTKYTYTGHVDADGYPDGKGTATYKGGLWKSYEGEWENGQWQGQGRLVYSGGDVYEGSFKNNEFDRGTYTLHPDANGKGDHFTGAFKNGQAFDGEWKHANGETFQVYRNGNIVE